ncbi:MAG: NAD+ synthase [Bdellovibrionales bacterium]|nr:NAD+ synthase [Bdellovibrionales bacterium]
MRIAIAQIAPIVGDFDKNVALISDAYERACSLDEPARLLLTPELSVSGYALLDLLDRPEIFTRTEAALERLVKLTRGKSTALAVGHVGRNPNAHGRAARNCVSVLEDGKVVFTQAKTLLPTYDVFDEARYFEPADTHAVWATKDEAGKATKVAFAICEDLWGEDSVGGRKIYGKLPADEYAKLGPDLLVSLSASPYEFGKRDRRESLHGDVAKKVGASLVYVNQIGATDDILFDGASFATDAKGALTGRLAAFRNAFAVYDTENGKFDAASAASREDPKSKSEPDELEVLVRGLVHGIAEYFSRTGFKLGVLGLSGGIDSAVVAALAVRALGKENVFGIAMPSQYSSGHSLADAEALARNLGIPFEVRPIKFLFSTAAREIGEARQGLAPIAQENLQSRLRGMILMTLSNHYNALVLTTGNKSEIATGYCTLYGDMCGALAPIGDVLKTRVYEVARRLNEWAVREGAAPPIPESTLTKAPSAELRPDQTDQDTLPPYADLDAMLVDYLELGLSVVDVVKKHGKWVPEILRKIELNEYKRRQGAPVLKVSTKAFGLGRRVPIAKVWDRKL